MKAPFLISLIMVLSLALVTKMAFLKSFLEMDYKDLDSPQLKDLVPQQLMETVVEGLKLREIAKALSLSDEHCSLSSIKIFIRNY
jgi:hypothetical protein